MSDDIEKLVTKLRDVLNQVADNVNIKNIAISRIDDVLDDVNYYIIAVKEVKNG